MRRGVVMSAVIVVGGLIISSCSGSPEGIPISSATLGAYRTPPGAGILCGGPGEYDFLTFAITKGVVSGHIVETDVSTRAELPMNGSSTRHTVTLLPLSGFGEFKGTVDGHSLDFSSVSGIAPSVSIQCSLESLAKWRTLADHTAHSTSRQLSTPEFLAMDDLTFARIHTDNASRTETGPFPTPASTLVQNFLVPQSRTVPGHAPSGYSEGAVPPEPYLSFTTGPVTRPNDISVDVSTSGYVLTFATRAGDGSCWYEVSPGSTFSTAPGVIESSCSALNVVPRTVKYEGP